MFLTLALMSKKTKYDEVRNTILLEGRTTLLDNNQKTRLLLEHTCATLEYMEDVVDRRPYVMQLKGQRMEASLED